MAEDLKNIKVGGVDDFRNFVNAVIDEESFNKLAKVIDEARTSPDAEVILGGEYDKSKGYFIHPTVILAKRPDYVTMREELFGPILTVYAYDPDKLDETMDLLDTTTDYALTGAIFPPIAQYRTNDCAFDAYGGQFLYQRQAHRCRGRSATLWWRTSFGYQRQSRIGN